MTPEYTFLFDGQVGGALIGGGVCFGRDFDPQAIYVVTIEETSTNMLGERILDNLRNFDDDLDLKIEGPIIESGLEEKL